LFKTVVATSGYDYWDEVNLKRLMDISILNPEDWSPSEVSEVISWHGHIPFAFSLMQVMQPNCFVELGTHKGDSYFAICEAVRHFGLSTSCFAVDTWAGDEHAGFYSNEIFEQVQTRNNQQFSGFSKLIRSTFDEALAQFADHSIDLLHIDGLHTYEAVRHDFETWRSKLSDKGIVLFHDTVVREKDFGVWKFWAEISAQYPSFEFHHSNGLGVLAVGSDASACCPDLFGERKEDTQKLRNFYATLGNSVAFLGAEKLISKERVDHGEELKKFSSWALDLDRLLNEERAIAGAEIQRLNNRLKEKGNTFFTKNDDILHARLLELEQQLSQECEKARIESTKLNVLLAEKKSRIAELTKENARNGKRLVKSQQELNQYRELSSEETAKLNALQTEQNNRIDELINEKHNRGKLILQLEHQLSQEREQTNTEVARLNTLLNEQESRINELVIETVNRGQWALDLDQQLRDAHIQITQMTSSKSWKLTAPLRWVVRVLNLSLSHPKEFLIVVLRKLYHKLPTSVMTKNRLKGWCYSHFPSVFSRTPSYSLWQARAMGVNPAPIILEATQDVGDPFDFVSTCSPVVSIVIPVYGKFEYTYRCLRSLWSHKSNYSFEVIVVDDCSTDNTAEALAQFSGIVFVRNTENLGFIRSCNKGAKRAKGKLLVMLNNDTVVRPDWLDELVNTFNIVPDAGLVGSKLIYPDGKLQEAGGIIWQDGSGWNFGRLGDTHQPEYNYLREVDYCSGASVMIPKALFDQLNGFDEYFAPAYGEDSDLAFRVREAGFKVLYQPLSQVIHFEGVTSGTDTASGIKAYQVENAKKLFERWKGVLANHGVPGVAPELEKDRSASCRVLVLDHCTPTPDQDAGSITSINIMRIMQSMGFKVTFIPEDNFLYVEPYTADLQRVGIECLYTPYISSVEQHLKDYGKYYDAVIFFRVTVAERNLPAINKFCPNAKLIFHTSDLHHLRELREAKLVGSEEMRNQAEITKKRELDVIRKVDATIVHSSTEKSLLEQELAGEDAANKVFLFSWAIDIPGTKKSFGEREGMVFVGGFQHQPNVDAVKYFAKDIFPLIRCKLPNAKFYIVGSRAPKDIIELSGENGIEFLGFVEDIQPLLDSCRLSIVPLRYGAGIKGKIGTSFSHALPCVSTSIGVEGMDLLPEEGILLGDTPEAFADAVIRLHEDSRLWQKLSIAGLDFVKRNYSLDAGKSVLKSILLKSGFNIDKIIEQPIFQNLASLMSTSEVTYQADQSEDPNLFAFDVDSKTAYETILNSADIHKYRATEKRIIEKHGQQTSYEILGHCQVCKEDVNFLVDQQCGAIEHYGFWAPNWRERLVCSKCSLNSRQRAMAAAIRDAVENYKDRRPDLYFMEQVTAIFQWVTTRIPIANCVGSEYLGADVEPGKTIQNIRHEDVENLSFENASFDLIVSNDVLEHVVNPAKALDEAYRVLRPGGKLLMTIPFYLDRDKCQRRADMVDGELVHILPAEYHGNPVSNDGSLVFTDFGWDFIQDIRNVGFHQVTLHFYWSEVYGYLGAGQHYIQAIKK
jgi:GT2 family glycosyltransferase/glycosyltransferase involved in cell wall biosynthesis/SAM-dependent methyltransferase